MRLITRARYALARWALKGMSWQYTPTWVARTALNGAFHALTQEGYKKAAAYFACVSTHAFTFPEPPLWVWDGEDDTAQPIPNHPIRRLLIRPNSDQDEVSFTAMAITWAAIGGNCYIHKQRNRLRQVIGLRPYHDGVFRPVPIDDPDGIDDGTGSWISHYMFRQTDGAEIEVPKEDVIHFQWPSPDPMAPWKAQPPIVAAARDVDAAVEATRLVATLLQNDAIPRTVITQSPQQALTPDETTRMRAEFLALHGGDSRGGVAILEAGAQIARLGLNMQELDVSALHDMSEQHICATMKVPSPVAGLGDDPTYANSEEASKRFTTDTRVPLWIRFASAIQAGLAEELGGGVFVRHYLGRVAALQEDANQKATRIYGGWDRGLLGFKEARAQLGILVDPDPADLFVASISRDLLPFRQILSPPAAEPATIVAPRQLPAPADDPPDDSPKMRHDAKAAATRTARALQRVRREVAGRMERRLTTYFDGLADDVVRRARDLDKAETKELPDVSQLLLPADGLDLVGLFRLFTIEVARASWELWNSAVDVELAFDERDPAVVAALAQSGDRIGDIEATTRAAIRAALQYGAAQGWSIDQLVRGDDAQLGLRDLVEATYQGRPRAIARTELGYAQQACAVARFEAAGVATVLVLDNGQDDPDDVCKQLNGTVQTLSWAKRNQLGHPNCTRSFAPIVE